LFETHGAVGRVNIVTDRDTGQPRGFGFVEMDNDAEGDKAIAAINGQDLDGRTLNVNEARPKTERSGGGGGGGFGRKRW
jgi:RNA recognition motif-containing protein